MAHLKRSDWLAVGQTFWHKHQKPKSVYFLQFSTRFSWLFVWQPRHVSNSLAFLQGPAPKKTKTRENSFGGLVQRCFVFSLGKHHADCYHFFLINNCPTSQIFKAWNRFAIRVFVELFSLPSNRNKWERGPNKGLSLIGDRRSLGQKHKLVSVWEFIY